MRLNEAIIKRIEEICREKDVSICEAALGGGKSPSAIYDLIKGRTKCSKVETVRSFCEGAGITLSEFLSRTISTISKSDGIVFKKSKSATKNHPFMRMVNFCSATH